MRKLLIFLSVFSILLLGAFSQKGARAAEPGYAGADTCKVCHEERYEGYFKSSHAVKADPRTPAAKKECETCHGPGLSHAEKGGGRGVGDVIPLSVGSRTPVEKINATCLQCHASGRRALWAGSMHQMRGLACTNCHNPHSGLPNNLTKPTEPEVCTGCHKQIKSMLQLPSHHPIREGKLNCSDCHNPHGTTTDKLISANYVNEKCYECHAEKRGPFLWEHAPVRENCLICHTPHGSSHDKLLVQKRPFLCQACHSNSRHPGTVYAQTEAQAGQSVYTTTNSRTFYRACSNCHSQIHGNNHSSGKFLNR